MAAAAGWLALLSAETTAPVCAQDGARGAPREQADRELEAVVAGLVRDQVALQLGDLRDSHRRLGSDLRELSASFDAYRERHRSDLEALEKRLRDDYAQDMGGMELWMRQEHGRALLELQREHQGALALLRDELVDRVRLHADRVEELDCRVKEGMALWSSVAGANRPATVVTTTPSTLSGASRSHGASAPAGDSRRDAMEDLPKDASWFAARQQRLRSGSAA
jgi:hypothetical protein